METLQTVLRSFRETKARKDHLDVFREFLSHLDRVGQRARRRNGAARSVGAQHAAPLQPTARRKA